MSTRQQIIELYRVWLYRDPDTIEEEDPGGLDHYQNKVDNEGWSFNQVADDLNGSPEFRNKAESKVKWWFEDAEYGPDRSPTQQELDHYVDRIKAVGWDRLDTIEGDIGNIYYTDRGYANQADYEAGTGITVDPTDPDVVPEPPTGDTGADKDSDFIIPGKGGDKFGDADYRELLNRTDGSYEQLRAVRNDVLAWIRDHPNKDAILASNNQPNSTPGENDDGLYERINTATPDFDREEGGRFFTQWGDPDMDVDMDGVSYSDILAWKAGNHSTFQIYSYMNRNKSQWQDSTVATEVYNSMRQELINRGNESGNMYGYEGWGQGDYPSDKWFSWKHTLENPLFQELGKYIKSSGVKDDKSVAWWMYDKAAYEETIDWLSDQHHNYDWLTADDSGRATTGPRTQEQLEELIGSTGVAGTGGVGVGGDYTEGEYWQKWGTEGPRTDGELNLAETQKMAAGLGLGTLDFTDPKIEDKLEEIEQRFLKEMFVGGTVRSSSGNIYTGQQIPSLNPKYHQAKDSWGLDLVRKNMNPQDWDEDWFENDELDNSWFQTLAYGDKDDIDWAFYRDNKYYKDAQEALGMDDKIDTIKEIREANTYVYAAVLADEHSDHLEDWIPYEPQFDNTTPIPEPIEIDVGDYKTPDKEELTPAPDRPDAPTINIPKVNVTAPDNMPSNLKIAGGEY